MKYLTETELRRLAEAGELVLWRWNGIWMCEEGAVPLPIYFTLAANEVRIFYDKVWRVSFSVSYREEFVVICKDYYTMTDTLYDIGLLMMSWLQDAYFTLNIDTDVWDIVRVVIAFLAVNADNDTPLPKYLINAIRKLKAPSTLVTLLKIQDGRNGNG